MSLAAFQAATGQETGGLSAPPGLEDLAGGDFTPALGSPLVDRGTPIPGVNDGWEGAAPDIGAVERIAALFADGFESGDTSAWSLAVP